LILELFGFQGDKAPRYVEDGNGESGEAAFKVADFIMELPLQKRDDTEKTAFSLDMYFGHMEIKIEVNIPGQDKKLTFKASYESNVNKNLRRSKGLPVKFQQEMKSLRSRSTA
jgi:hypothetical protein